MPTQPLSCNSSTSPGKLRRAWQYVWPVLRQVVGWLLIILGVLGLFLPVLQGVLFLMLGIALVGRRNWLIRWVCVNLKLMCRRWAAHPHPLLGRSGALARRAQQQLSRQRRRMHWRWQERKSVDHRT